MPEGKKNIQFSIFSHFKSFFFLFPACHQAVNLTLRHAIFMGMGVGLQPGEREAGGTSAALAPGSVPIPGTGTRTLSQPSCGSHPRMSPHRFPASRHPSPAPSQPPALLGWCLLSLHGHSGMDVPLHPNAEPVPSPLPGLGKCHQPFIRLAVTTVHFSKGCPSPPHRGDLQGCIQPQ